MRNARALSLAASLFDVAGGSGNYLVLGLEARPDRDIDAYEDEDGRIIFVGYRRHFDPAAQKLIHKLREEIGVQAFQAWPDGLKTLAVESGIGSWGKNSLVIHPKFGSRLRFAALLTNLDFDRSADARTPCADCVHCRLCVEACPRGLFNGEIDGTPVSRESCLANPDIIRPSRRCGQCHIVCPIGL